MTPRAMHGWIPSLGAAIVVLAASPARAQEPAATAAPSSLTAVGLRSGRTLTGAVQRIDNAGIVIGTPHGSITVPWEQMDDATLTRFSQYAPLARPSPDLPGELPDESPDRFGGAARSGRSRAGREPLQTLLGMSPRHLLIWAAVSAAILAASVSFVPGLARRRRRPLIVWLTLALAVPLFYWAVLWLIPDAWLIVLRPAAPVIPLLVPLILVVVRKRKPSPEELARRMAALEPAPLKTISLKKPKTDTQLTVLDRRTWEKERTAFDRRFFERFLIPWFREIQGSEAVRPILTVRARGRAVRVRRLVQADEVGVLIALEESGDPLANAERYPYAEIEEVTIARTPAPSLGTVDPETAGP